VCQNTLYQIACPSAFALQVKLPLRVWLFFTLPFEIANDSSIEQRDLVRFIFAVTFLNHERIVGIIAGAKIVRSFAPRFFSCVQAFRIWPRSFSSSRSK